MGRVLLFTLLVGAVAFSGCTDEQFIGEDGFIAFALTDTTPAFVEGEEESLFLVEERIELPVRVPSDTQMAELVSGAGEVAIPFARLPWVQRHDYEIEVDYVLINLDDSRSSVDVVINGFNEFHEYLPGVIFDDDEIIPEFAQWERFIVLEPLERRFGTIREEEFDEIAVDLATVVNGVSNANQIVHPNNHSSTDRRSQEFIPEVIPALTGLRVGLRATSTSNVVIEITVRVRDVSSRIVSPANAWELPVPELFLPSSVMVVEP